MRFSSLKIRLQPADGLVIFRYPGETKATLLLGKWTSTKPTSKTFVFANHNAEKTHYLDINDEHSISVESISTVLDREIQAKLQLSEQQTEHVVDKKQYETAIAKAITLLHSSGSEKVVLSRPIHKKQTSFHGESLQNLMQANQHALVYYAYLPGIGCWMGASPEKLMDGNSSEGFTTFSLAGTKTKYTTWTSKEIREQQLVTEYILNNLQNNGANTVSTSPATTVDVGRFHHLKSEIRFHIAPDKIEPLLFHLHPTPAVCGTPKNKAVKIIAEIESYNRSYYTGFLGLLSESETALYVNLRCLQFFNNGYTIYVGGGITKQSDPAAEWSETELKSEVINSCLHIL